MLSMREISNREANRLGVCPAIAARYQPRRGAMRKAAHMAADHLLEAMCAAHFGL